MSDPTTIDFDDPRAIAKQLHDVFLIHGDEYIGQLCRAAEHAIRELLDERPTQAHATHDNPDNPSRPS